VYELTLRLLEKKEPDIRGPRGRIISAAELHQRVPAPARKEYDVALRRVTKGDVSQAATHFEQALAIYPEYLAARNDLGAQYLKLKRIDEAEAHFRNVLERDPKNLYAMFNLGLGRIERRDYAGAIGRCSLRLPRQLAPTRTHGGFAMLEQVTCRPPSELNKALVMGGGLCRCALPFGARLLRGDNNEASRD
jgi:hypothetical protein